MNNYSPAAKKTMYFIGVTTGKSSIMKVFPPWVEHMGLNAIIKGIDFVPHSDPALYREAVEFIKKDPLSMGALVTTHKLDLVKARKDIFDGLLIIIVLHPIVFTFVFLFLFFFRFLFHLSFLVDQLDIFLYIQRFEYQLIFYKHLSSLL